MSVYGVDQPCWPLTVPRSRGISVLRVRTHTKHSAGGHHGVGPLFRLGGLDPGKHPVYRKGTLFQFLAPRSESGGPGFLRAKRVLGWPFGVFLTFNFWGRPGFPWGVPGCRARLKRPLGWVFWNPGLGSFGGPTCEASYWPGIFTRGG